MSWRGKPRIKVSQVNREPLEQLQTLFDGPICLDGGPARKKANPRRQEMWYWSLSGPRAEAVMRAVYPYMSQKRRDQIDLALQ